MKQNFITLNFKDKIPYSKKFDDYYYSKFDKIGLKESSHNFLKINGLLKQFKEKKKHFYIAEIGFGLAINFLNIAYNFIKHAHKESKLSFFSVEKFPIRKKDLNDFYNHFPHTYQSIIKSFLQQYPIIPQGEFQISLFKQKITLSLVFDDVLTAFKSINQKIDYWFLDGFSPKNNPDIWDEKVIQKIALHSKKNTKISSFSVNSQLCSTLEKQGFNIKKKKGFLNKKHCLFATYSKDKNEIFFKPYFHINQSKKLNKKKAIVIGAGIGGVSIACALAKRDWEIKVFEKKSKLAPRLPDLALVKPLLTKNNDDLLAKFSLNCFAHTLSYIKKLQAKYSDIIIQDGLWQISNKKNTYNKQLDYFIDKEKVFPLKINKEQIAYHLKNHLIINTKNLIQNQINQYKDNIKIDFYNKIYSFKNDSKQWLIFDEQKKCIAKAPILILAQGIEAKNIKTLTLKKTYGQIISFNNDYKLPSMCFDGQYLLSYKQKLHLGGIFSTKSFLHCQEIAKEIINKFKQKFPQFDLSKLKIINHWQSSRCHSLDYFPIVGELSQLEFLNQFYNDLYKGKDLKVYPKSQKTNLFIHTAFGSRGLSYSFLTAELLANIINGEAIFFNNKLLEKLHPNRFYIRENFFMRQG